MKSIKFILLATTVSTLLFGCSKSSSKSSADYIDATINGVAYHEDISSDVHFFLSNDGATCDKKNYLTEYVGIVETSNFNLRHHLKFYESDSLLSSYSKTGSYSVKETMETITLENSCNLSLLVAYWDESLKKYYTLLPGGVHTVTSITKSASTATSQDYVIKGSYNCKFVHPTTKDTLSCSGTYQKTIEASKP